MTELALTVGLAYLLGSIPFGYLLVRLLRGEDVRQTGSGNIGATNVSRTSLALGIVTLVLDATKGLAAVSLARVLFPGSYTLAGVAALSAIVGHLFPFWLRFRGGKGVATGIGTWISLAPKSVVAAVAVLVAAVALFRYVSLGSIAAAALLPLLAWAMNDYHQTPALLASMVISSLLIIAKHRSNVRRLLAGTEGRFGVKHP